MESESASPPPPSPTTKVAFGDNLVAGSRFCPYKLAIVGGGPSGCSILVRAARIGLIPDLCSFTELPPSSSGQVTGSDQLKGLAGVCMIDAGGMDRIGGGRLQDYVINSNTWINKFASNVVEEKPENIPPETIKGTCFEPLLQSFTVKQIEDYGNKTGPLKAVGGFLREVGKRAVATLEAYPTSSKCLVRTKVESLHRVLDSSGKFACWKIVIVTTTPPDGTNSMTSEVVRRDIFALHVTLATGGYQPLPTFNNPSYRAKLISSDVVCTMEGVEHLRQRIRRYLQNNTGGNNLGAGRVVIIGGSHSAFSAAWICLNLVNEDAASKAANVLPPNNNVADNGINKFLPGTPPLSFNAQHQIKLGPSAICMLHRSAIRVFYATRADAEHDHYPESCICVNRITGNINPFGGIRGDAKELWRAVRSGREGRVRLLQVKNVPLNAPSGSQTNHISNGRGGSHKGTAEADSASSTPVKPSTASAPAIVSSAGLKQSIVDKMLEEAVVIVWAAGYHSNLIPVYDVDGSCIQFDVCKGQVTVDDHANLVLSAAYRGPLAGGPWTRSAPTATSTTAEGAADHGSDGVPVGFLYGSGLGFGLRATLDNGEPDGSVGRADGVAVYLKRGATLVLAQVLGNRAVYGDTGATTWEERNALLKKQQQKQQQQAQPPMDCPSSPGHHHPHHQQPRAQTSKSPLRRSQQLPSGTSVRNLSTVNGHDNTGAASPATPLSSPNRTSNQKTTSSVASAKRPASAGRLRTPPSSSMQSSLIGMVPTSPASKKTTGALAFPEIDHTSADVPAALIAEASTADCEAINQEDHQIDSLPSTASSTSHTSSLAAMSHDTLDLLNHQTSQRPAQVYQQQEPGQQHQQRQYQKIALIKEVTKHFGHQQHPPQPSLQSHQKQALTVAHPPGAQQSKGTPVRGPASSAKTLAIVAHNNYSNHANNSSSNGVGSSGQTNRARTTGLPSYESITSTTTTGRPSSSINGSVVTASPLAAALLRSRGANVESGGVLGSAGRQALAPTTTSLQVSDHAGQNNVNSSTKASTILATPPRAHSVTPALRRIGSSTRTPNKTPNDPNTVLLSSSLK